MYNIDRTRSSSSSDPQIFDPKNKPLLLWIDYTANADAETLQKLENVKFDVHH